MRKNSALRAVPVPTPASKTECPFKACRACNPPTTPQLPPLSHEPIPAPVQLTSEYNITTAAVSVIRQDIAKTIDTILSDALCFYTAPDAIYDDAQRGDVTARAALDAAARFEKSIRARVLASLKGSEDFNQSIASAIRNAFRDAYDPKQ